MKLLTIILAAIVMTGCATKQYPQATDLTVQEQSVFECKDVQVELAKAYSQKLKIDETGGFNAETISGFMLDFGIGNAMAKSKAYAQVNERISKLEELKKVKCNA